MGVFMYVCSVRLLEVCSGVLHLVNGSGGLGTLLPTLVKFLLTSAARQM